MRVLGIEGTAWAASAAIFDDADGIIAMETDPYVPAEGGIHPTEAAAHMAEAIPEVIEAVLTVAEPPRIDVVAFSQGPGLGPCLRIVATAARTIAQTRTVPLVGVNHMIAHLEVGRRAAGFADPICLNASGANAHVLGRRGNRYRVLGETLDTGVGNAIDKFTRHLGWSHPGGPKVEAHAEDGSYIDLPYVVKGMDFSFSGIMSAAKEATDAGTPIADVCYGLQETIFAMLTEVAERALSLTGRDELVLGGGVGQNARLRAMLRSMCNERGATFGVPENRLLRDNAGMIAILGAAMADAGETVSIEESTIRADFRPDEVPIAWRPAVDTEQSDPSAVDHGAEAILDIGKTSVSKTRVPKAYRHPTLDAKLRRERTGAEARLTSLARRKGVPTPVLQDVDPWEARLELEVVGEADLRDRATPATLYRFGHHLATCHGAGIIHGDPTVRNARVAAAEPSVVDDAAGRVYVIDFGLGFHSEHVEDRAMDLHVLSQSVDGTVDDAAAGCDAVWTGYEDGASVTDVDAATVFAQVDAIIDRGRYR